ncbi:MAG: ECF-type sigma factor [Acidobacteriota bacterium]
MNEPAPHAADSRSVEPSIEELLARWRSGEAQSLEALLPQVYDAMCRIARNLLRSEPLCRGLEPEALVHEVYLQLARRRSPRWRGEGHFFAVVALLMRRHLVDRSRRAAAQRRGGALRRADLPATDWESIPAPAEQSSSTPCPSHLDLHQAFQRLRRSRRCSHRRAARVLLLRAQFGLTLSETATALGVAPATVTRDWRGGCAWLRRELQPAPGSSVPVSFHHP